MTLEIISKASGITAPPNGPWIEVSLDRILKNLVAVRQKAGPDLHVMAVVKANAYGHGLIPVARALSGKVDFLGVASIREGFLLREQKIETPIFVFGKIFPKEIPAALQKNLALTVSSLEEAKAISETSLRLAKKAVIHVKVDTGMGRLGIPFGRAFSEIVTLASLAGIHLEGIYTHCPTAERHPDFFTEKQLSNFEKLIQDLEARGITFAFRHAANSAGALRFKSPWLNLIRPGLALYGIYPDPCLRSEVPLLPALSLKSRIVFLKRLSAGDSVGYGREYLASSPTTIAVIPTGYAHGYPFQLSGRAEVLFRGKRFSIAGRVCMDSLMVDLGPATQVRPGDEVTLLGSYGEEQISAEDLARLAQTIPYEIVTRLESSVPRFYYGSQPSAVSYQQETRSKGISLL